MSHSAKLSRPAQKLPTLWAYRELTTRAPEFFLRMRERYGDVTRVRFGPVVMFTLHHPEDIEAMLVTQAKSLIKDKVTRDLALVLGRGSLTADGATWRSRRRIAAPSLKRRHVEAYADTMVRHARVYADRLEDGSWREVHEDMLGVTLMIVSEALFSADVTGDIGRLGKALGEVMSFWDRELNTWRRLVPLDVALPSRRAIRRPMAEVHDVITRIILERREAIERGEQARDDLISRWLVASKDDDAPLSDADLRDEAITFFAAGHETTAIAVTMAMYFVSLHSEVEASLHAEWETVLGARDPAFGDIAALTWTEAVCKETLRLHPPAWVVGREAPHAMHINNIEVPKGAQVMASAFAVHRDPRWYRAPERFAPERWLEQRQRHRFAFFPFGGGPRICIGNHFAMMEMILMLATIGRRVRFEPQADYQLERLAAITMRPRHGMPMRVARRAC